MGLWDRLTGREVTEAKQAGPIKALPGNTPSRQGYIYGVPPGGTDENAPPNAMGYSGDRRQQLSELYQAYLKCPWAWACVQAIARTVTAGGLETDWDGDDGEGDQEIPDKPPAVLALEQLLAFVNPQQNIRQLLRNFIADLQVFADGYIEVVWSGSVPVALYNQDSPTTMPEADDHGNITGYVQIDEYGRKVHFEPHEIIHVSLDAARPGITGVSPMQAAEPAILAWIWAASTGKEAMRKGLPPNVHVDFPSGKQESDLRTWRDKYLSQNVGPKNIGTPVQTIGGATVKELQTGKIADVITFKNQCRDEILSIFGVPPAKAGVIESGNLGGGTGDSQDVTYHLDTCAPIAELVAEAFTWALAVQAFGITDWKLKFGDADYRDSKLVEDIRSQRIRDGLYTLNRARAEVGEPTVDGGDDAVLVLQRTVVVWSDVAGMSAAAVTAAGQGGQPQQPDSGEAPDAPQDGVTAPGQQAKPGDGKQDDAKPPRDREKEAAVFRTRLAEALKQLPDLGDEDEPQVAHEPNQYPQHAMTAQDAGALLPKIIA